MADESEAGSEQQGGELQARRAKLERWRARGIDPFGARFERTHLCAEVTGAFAALEGREVRVAGRLTALRRQGRAAFADITDRSGALQLFVRADALGTEAFEDFAHCDLGDHLGAWGTVMRTRAGQISVEVVGFTFLSKALRPLPDKYHGLRDTEIRYRRRYLDLLATPQARDRFVLRSRMVSAIRRFLDGRDFLEVETPILQHVASGAEARPFVTRHNALGLEMHLRIALELHLKRLVVGGLERVYEIGRVFRNEGVSTRHNPEFTILECYQAFADYEDMMVLVEDLFAQVATDVLGTTNVHWRGHDIDLRPPWRRVSMVAALEARGLDLLAKRDDARARAMAQAAGVAVPDGATWGQVVDACADALILPELIAPTFLVDHPLDISPLARAKPGDGRLAARFEPVIAGMEMGNAFSELNDPDEQRQRFLGQADARRRGHAEAQQGDEDFLLALEHGLPPTGGLGLGIDRLAMMLSGADSIRDVILFPHLRSAP